MKVARIVAALHPRRPIGTQVDVLAKHALAMNAEVVGLFVEDIDMLRFAAMPFACEIGTASARRRTTDVAAVERYMADRAAELRQTLGRVLDHTTVVWSFRVARGTVPEQLLAAAVEQEGAVLLLPPGARIELTPVNIARSDVQRSPHKLVEVSDQPILLLPG